ncbi:hypothetical protein LEMLEM_LOCUS13426 [Lemmus lemmus]
MFTQAMDTDQGLLAILIRFQILPSVFLSPWSQVGDSVLVPTYEGKDCAAGKMLPVTGGVYFQAGLTLDDYSAFSVAMSMTFCALQRAEQRAGTSHLLRSSSCLVGWQAPLFAISVHCFCWVRTHVTASGSEAQKGLIS